ncbi:glycosyltransferase family 1 protein [bacterium]|nr:MAG: glycosyltransferase family 1 protein [bacterium]
MKICVIAYKFGTEKEIGEHLGTYHYFIEKMRRLARQGHEVLVVAPWISFWRKGSEEVDGVKIARYWPPLFNHPKLLFLNSFFRYLYIRATQRKVLQANERKKFDIYYVWQARETGFAISQIKDKLKAPFFFRQITAWEWHFERGILDGKKQQFFARQIYEKADKVVFVSKAASREALDAGLQASKVEVIGVGIETDIFAPQGRQEDWRQALGISGGKVMLFIGRINFAEKGIGFLLEAMPEIITAVPGVNLAIIGGGGESERMNRLIDKLGIREHVQVLGKKPFSDLPKYLNASDVMVVPSSWIEHFGQVTVEAMSCGVPVVTTDTGGSPEINIDRQTGFVVPAKDSPSLATAAVKILTDSVLRDRLGKAARVRVEENFTYEVLINKFLQIIKPAGDNNG